MPEDHAHVRQRLDKAEDDIHKAEIVIAEQKARIEKLQADGHNVSAAEKVLHTLEGTLHVFKQHRNIILEELGLYEPTESGADKVVPLPKRGIKD